MVELKRYPMTPDGHADLVEELKQLKTVERPEIVEAIGEAREHGDLSENAEYHAAKDKQGFVEARINEIEGKLALSQVIDISKLKGDKVTFGMQITIVNDATNEEASYQIVGEDEANIAKGKISITAPIARAFIGKEVGDVVEVRTPSGLDNYEILDIAF